MCHDNDVTHFRDLLVQTRKLFLRSDVTMRRLATRARQNIAVKDFNSNSIVGNAKIQYFFDIQCILIILKGNHRHAFT